MGPAPGSRGPVVVVAIHGLGDSPEAFLGWLRGIPVAARVISMRGIERYGPGFAWWRPFADEARLAEAIDHAAATVRERVAPALALPRCGRPIVLGFSQGAMVSFALAARGTLDAGLVIPIGGRLPLENRGVNRPTGQRPVVRAMHGELDVRMPLSAARSTVSALAQAGMDASLRAFAGVAHEITAEVRDAVFDEVVRAARAMGCAP
jgi:predicted esterase